MVYLDYNATTPIDKEVADAMLTYLYSNFSNNQTFKDFFESTNG